MDGFTFHFFHEEIVGRPQRACDQESQCLASQCALRRGILRLSLQYANLSHPIR